MQILVTGATGVVGIRVVPLLLAQGHRVRALGRSPERTAALERAGATVVRADLFDPGSLRPAVSGCEVVLNLATHMPASASRLLLPGAWAENDRVRRLGSANLVDAALAANVPRFVQESFAPAYPDAGDRWIGEETPLHPTAYNRTILDAEASAARFTSTGGGAGVVLRFAGFYGPDARLQKDLIALVRHGWVPLPPRVLHDARFGARRASAEVPSGVDGTPLRKPGRAAVAFAPDLQPQAEGLVPVETGGWELARGLLLRRRPTPNRREETNKKKSEEKKEDFLGRRSCVPRLPRACHGSTHASAFPSSSFKALLFGPLSLFLAAAAVPAVAAPGDLARTVRLKASAGDLFTGEAAVAEYKREHGVDAEYLGALGWLARSAALLGKTDKAWGYVAELRREIPAEKEGLTIALGAAIETEGRLRAQRDGRGPAIRFFESEYARAKDTELRARLRKNVNLLSLEGQPAPEIASGDHAGAAPPALSALKGRPVLVFLWAHWCGDCRAQAPILGRVLEKYRGKGLAVVAPTRLFGTGAENKPATPAEEKAHVAKVWKESYGMLDGVSAPIDTETMLRWGVSANPTIALVDKKGLVRLYTPTRVSEEELSRRVEELLAE